MRVFLDTNILLDIIEGRQQFLLASSNVFDLGIRGLIEMFATPLTFANCVYTARKNVGYEQALKGLGSHGDRHLGMGACFHGNFFAIFLMVS